MGSDTKSGGQVLGEKWEVGPTEDVVQALMNTLVDPLLPSSLSNAVPSQDHQVSVAKQMHAVILLYNYYHRKQKPELLFLDFVSFCKLAVVVKPPLTSFMKVLMKNEPIGLHCTGDNRLSVTEEAMGDACDIAVALDASRNVPEIQGWPISKVAVLMIDSTKEICLLQFGTVTQGVWSPIEKEVNEPSIYVEISTQEKVCNKRKTSSDKASMGDAYFLELAYDAVKDATGYDSSNLEVLETHITYSLSKCKSATCFFMMQYCGSFRINEQVPLKFLVESLQGPLARKLAYGVWETTQVVEHHHMLPYLGLISSWLSREGLCLSSLVGCNAQSTINNCEEEFPPDCTNCADCFMDNRNKRSKLSSCGEERSSLTVFQSVAEDGNVVNRFDKDVLSSPKNSSNDSWQCDKRGLVIDPSGWLSGEVVMGDDVIEKPEVLGSSMKEKSQIKNEMLAEDNDKFLGRSLSGPSTEPQTTDLISKKVYPQMGVMNNSSAQNNTPLQDDGGPLKVDDVDSQSLYNPLIKDGKVSRNEIDVLAPTGKQLVRFESNTEYDAKVEAESVLASEVLQNAKALLFRKRQEVHSQMCIQEDILALYEDTFARIRDGGEVGLARRCIKSILAGNNNLLLLDGNSDSEQASEIYIPGKSPCQDLEYVCAKNNWRLPRYITEPSYGKFLSRVIVKGKDFGMSAEGSLESSPARARESAAAHMIAKMQTTFA